MTDEIELAALTARIAELEAALTGMTARYCELVNSGDAGRWNPENDPEVRVARLALSAKIEGASHDD